MRLLIAASLLIAVSSASAQMYRWTDQSGRTHFTDTPPPASAKSVQKRRGGTAAQDDEGNRAEPYALQMARKNNPVKLYSAPGCGAACDEARNLLNSRGVPFTEVSVSNQSHIQELKQLIGSAAVPALVVGSNIQRGFEPGAYHGVLDSAGYPRAGILPPRHQAAPQQPSPEAEAQGEAGNAEQPPAVVRGPYAPIPAR